MSDPLNPPKIPNLLSLRKGARGSARGGPFTNNTSNTPFTSNSSSPRTPVRDKDRVIRDTDCDAASSRVSAVEAGYLGDVFARGMSGIEGGVRRLPLMNRGTYVRTTAIDRIVDTFLSSEGSSTPKTSTTEHTPDPSSTTKSDTQQRPKQIISLGAGSDTRYFRLKQDKKHIEFTYHELDFRENNQAKISRLRDTKCVDLVRRECGIDLDQAESDVEAGELRLGEYSIHTVDLRVLPASLPWLDTQASTLLISECCLIYLSPDAADNTLRYFSTQLQDAPLAIAIYEPFRPNDSFGQTMIRNLMTRGIVLQTIEKYADLEKQRDRLAMLGMEGRAMDCEEIWRGWVRREEKERIDKLEWMDEVEEFVLLAKHYCVAWGWREFGEDEGWRGLG